MNDRGNLVELARRSSRDEFSQTYRCRFLLGGAQIERPRTPRSTVVGLRAMDLLEQEDLRTELIAGATDAARERLLLPVRKVQSAFASMITVGRTANNDVVLPDVGISRFHAYFKILPDGRLELGDAGSANGTRCGGVALEPKGAAVEVRSGDRVSFAHLEFVLLDAAAAWDQVRAASR